MGMLAKTAPHTPFVPAKAGTQSYNIQVTGILPLGPRLRGDERNLVPLLRHAAGAP